MTVPPVSGPAPRWVRGENHSRAAHQRASDRDALLLTHLPGKIHALRQANPLKHLTTIERLRSSWG